MAAERYLVGVDVGGTFTDILCYEPDSRRMLSAKVPSLPGQQWRGVLESINALGIDGNAIEAFVHGTTIATNALLERKGAKTGLVTTEGFRDTLEIGKGRRLIGGLFDIAFERPPPIVPRPLRLEAPERVAADGSVLSPLDGFDFADIAEAFEAAGVETVAIAFLNAHVNDANERRAGERLAELLDGVPVSRSADVVAERGEFERTSTCVINAYLTPLMSRYLDTLRGELAENGVTAPVNIMGSNGGAMPLERAADYVVGTFLSGPVGGVAGAVRMCAMAGVNDCITFDMGGTSTDVALIHDLVPRMSHDNQIDAYPLRVPQYDIHTIGAGGGSIIWVQPDGTLGVGPQSAGAMPGPACYGRGGTEATISDANLLLGRLPEGRSLSGGLELSRDLAETAFRRLGDALGVDDLSALADSALRIAVAKMAGAVREVSVHRGYDPRDFVLIGFGGAGPMHVFMVADELAIPRVIVPRFPGHLSALGQMLADFRRDSVLVWGGRLNDLGVEDLAAQTMTLRTAAAAHMSADGVAEDRQGHAFALDMRYCGQSFTLAIPWADGTAEWEPLRTAFAERHIETFGYADPDNDCEIVNVRLVSTGLVDKPELSFEAEPTGDPLVERRQVWFDGGWTDCPVYDRAAMAVGSTVAGPAIIEEAGGTSILPPGWRCVVDASGSLICDADHGE